jgi:hypothetical protein
LRSFFGSSQLKEPQSFSLNFQFGGGHFAPQSECLTTKILPEVVNEINISRMLQMAADIAGQFTAIVASVAVLSRRRHSSFAFPTAITRSRPTRVTRRSRLREAAAGRKIGCFKK